uniref:Uncharacterized protein n=1 Tax=Lepeophtheirus salmonis TaxID=72036 RepID=A0A0K2VC16_LEPSM
MCLMRHWAAKPYSSCKSELTSRVARNFLLS